MLARPQVEWVGPRSEIRPQVWVSLLLGTKCPKWWEPGVAFGCTLHDRAVGTRSSAFLARLTYVQLSSRSPRLPKSGVLCGLSCSTLLIIAWVALNCTARPTALCVLHVCQGTQQMHNHLEAFLERPHLRQYKGFHLVCSRKMQESNNRLLEQIWHASSNAIGCCGLAVSASLVVKVACLCALPPRLLSLVASQSGIGFQGGGCPLQLTRCVK